MCYPREIDWGTDCHGRKRPRNDSFFLGGERGCDPILTGYELYFVVKLETVFFLFTDVMPHDYHCPLSVLQGLLPVGIEACHISDRRVHRL